MNLSPIDPRRSERHLLAAVHRWARTIGWRTDKPRGYRWVNGNYDTMTLSVEWSISTWGGAALVLHRVTDRRPADNLAIWSRPTVIPVVSVVQAVDVLVALAILPPLWSSAYALAVERYSEQIECLEKEIARKDRYLAMGDQTIAGLIEANTELRRAAAIPQLSTPYPYPKVTVTGGEVA